MSGTPQPKKPQPQKPQKPKKRKEPVLKQKSGPKPKSKPDKDAVDARRVQRLEDMLDRWAQSTLGLKGHTNNPTVDIRRTLAVAMQMATLSKDPDHAKVFGLTAVAALKALSEIRVQEIKANQALREAGRNKLPFQPSDYDAIVDAEPEPGPEESLLTAVDPE